MTELVSQAEYARRKGVSRKTVTTWKSEGRITIVGDRVDVDASEARLQETTRHRATKARAAVTSAATSEALSVTRPLCGDHLAGEDYGALAAAQRLVELAPGILRLAAIHMGVSVDPRLEAQFRVSMMETVALLLNGMGVPPPPDCGSWVDAPMWAPDRFATVAA